MTRTRTWQVAIARGLPVRKVEEKLVGTGDRGLIVVWLVVATGELVEQKYVRKSDRWQRYEEWLEWRDAATGRLRPWQGVS
jgi:hypothetical protein